MGTVKEVLTPIYEKLEAEFVAKNGREPGLDEEGLLWERAGDMVIAGQKTDTKFVWVADMETPYFSWLSSGFTKKEAIDALRKRWDRHIKAIPTAQRGEAKTWKQFEGGAFEYFGGHCRLIQIGAGYRDSEDVRNEATHE
jgi:hypothetical protein